MSSCGSDEVSRFSLEITSENFGTNLGTIGPERTPKDTFGISNSG
jgi:hypothetical protein